MASKNISFEKIPASIRKPGKYFEFNTKLAVRTLPANAQRVLVIGQRLAAGSVPALTAVDVYSDAEAAAYFGEGSIAHRMARAAIKAYAYLALTVIALDDPQAGVKASGTVTLAGTATGSGLVTLQVGDDLVQVAAASGNAAADIAAALAAQAAKQPDLPVTAAAAGGVLTLTAKHAGELGNQIPLAATSDAAGITATPAAMSAGAGTPDIASALAAAFGAGHDILIVAGNSQAELTALRTHLDAVSGPLEQRGAIGIYGVTGTLAQGTTLAGQINSGRISGGLLPYSPSLPWEVGAAYGAVVASEEDPARPLNTLPLTGIAVPPLDKRLGRVEQETSLHNGCTPLEVGPGGVVQIVRAVSTYTLDPQGVEDVSLLDLTTIRTLDYVRKAVRERISLRFPREKLSARTPDKVRSEILDVLVKLEDLEIVEEVAANKDGVVVERDLQDVNRLNAKIPVDIVNGLHVFAGRIDLLL